MILSHRIKLEPTVEQLIGLHKAAGCARYAWNWALTEWQSHYRATGKSPNVFELKKRWNREKPAWVLESPKDANQQVFTYLKTAYTKFFKKIAGHPRLKRKGKARDSFYLSNDKFKLTGTRVRIPRIGAVKLTESLRFTGRVLSATVSRTADRWFISVKVDLAISPTITPPTLDTLGIDVGLKHFAVYSDGSVQDAPKPLKAGLKRLQRLSRRHSRCKPASLNKVKLVKRLARHHYRVTYIRQDFLHKFTTQLASKAKTLVIEDLNIKGMVRNRSLARSLQDAGLAEFRRQLAYKCQRNGTALVAADRWYPSTQLCSGCGAKQKLDLSERTYHCHVCDIELNRDLNAAINLSTVGYTGIQACGQEGSDWKHTFLVKPSWMKQELNLAAFTGCYK